MLVGFLPFVMGSFHSYIALVSWPGWTGYVKGAELSILDAVAFTLYLTLPSDRRPIPFLYAMVFYFLATVLSTFDAAEPTAALFYSCQIARVFLLYIIVSKACADVRVAPAILMGMAAGILTEAIYTIWQRFGLGMLQ